MSLLERLKAGLNKTRTQITSILGSEGSFDDDFYSALEDALISADIGVELSTNIIDGLKERIRRDKIATAPEAYEAMKALLVEQLQVHRLDEDFPPKPWVILVVGVNGVGKTTTIGKIAHELRGKGKSVMLGAVDTFRAGAIEQLRIWAERTGSEFIAQHDGADAASVAFDAMEAARARNVDVLILDTAGRLHNKINLMNEIEKILRVIRRNTPHAPNEILLVVDATTGQNAMKQVAVFNDVLGITGLVITKLDGTAKGGVALALAKTYRLPIKKIGVGEGIDDLQDFNAPTYIEAMFGYLTENSAQAV
ncbi:MAG: signal recognition particle-docking protein FtsY [Chitinispirillaceae bacterium]|nr:signal recognition particle-docking protein FtsY [Chitinispirillaceae bacterium]